MVARLDHTIVWCRDKQRSASFVAGILGLPAPKPLFHFMVVELGNGVSLDFMEKRGSAPAPQHYAFLVDEAEFDAGYRRITDLGLTHWADPERSQPGRINHRFGGRGVYFEDPDGHLLELLTTPYSEDLA